MGGMYPRFGFTHGFFISLFFLSEKGKKKFN